MILCSDDSIWLHDFSKCVFAVPSAANDRAVHFALVWRNRSRLDDVHDVFPSRLVAWLSLCPFAAAAVYATNRLDDSSCFARSRRGNGVSHSGRILAAQRR